MSNSKFNITHSQANLILLNNITLLLKEKSPHHSLLYEALDRNLFHLKGSELFTHVNTRNEGSPWLKYVERRPGSCLVEMVGPWTWDHILDKASWLWDSSKNSSIQNQKVNLFLNDIVLYVNYTLEHLTLLRPEHLDFQVALRKNPKPSSLEGVPKDFARLMSRNGEISHPQIPLDAFLNPIYTDESHQNKILSLTSQNPRVSNQEKLTYYMPTHLGSYSINKDDFFFHDAHYLHLEWVDLESRINWDLVNTTQLVDNKNVLTLYAENRIDIAATLLEDLALKDRLNKELTLNHLKPTLIDGLIAHNETLNLPYNFLRKDSGVDYLNYQSLIKYSGDVVLKSLVDPTGCIKKFPIRFN